MNDIDFPVWISTSPALAMAAVLGRALQQTYRPPPAEFIVGDRSAEHKGGTRGRDGRRQRSEEHRRAKLMVRAVSGAIEAASSTSSFGSDSDSDTEGGGRDVFTRRCKSGRKEEGDEDDDEFCSVASSSSNSEYDPMERPHLQTHMEAARDHRRVMQGRSSYGNSYSLAGFAAKGPSPLPSSPPAAPPMVDILHEPRVQKLFHLSGINAICCASAHGDGAGKSQRPLRISRKHAIGIVALFAVAVECRGLPSDATKGLYTECSSLYTALLALLRDGVAFCDGVDVEGFTASLVACGLKMRSGVEEDEEGEDEDEENENEEREAEGGEEEVFGGRRANRGAFTPRSRNVGLSGFDPRMIDAAIVDCIPDSIDACASNAVVLGVLRGLACTHSRRPIYLSPALVNHLHDLTDAFATSPKRRELSYKKLLSLLLEAMSCSLAIDYERANNWIMAIMQEAYVVRGLFQREVLHARVVAATLTLLVRQYQEMAAEYAATCGSVEGMPDFSEGDQLIELVWRALQDALQGWGGGHGESGEVTAPTKPQTLYGANLRIVVENLLRVEVERLHCFRTITCASTAYQRKILSLYASSTAAAAATTAAAASSSSIGLSPPLPPPPPPRRSPGKGKREDNRQRGEDGAGYALYFPSDEEEVLRVRVASSIVRFLLLPTSVLNVLPRGEATAALRSDIVSQCSQVLTIVSATEFTRSGVSAALDNRSGVGATASTTTPHNNNNNNTAAAAATVSGAALTSLPTTPRPKAAGGLLTAAAHQRVQFSNGYYRSMQSIVRELIRVLVKAVERAPAPPGTDGPVTLLPASVINTVDGAAAAAEACLRSLCTSDAHVRSFAVSEVTDAVVRVSGGSIANLESDPKAAAAAADSLGVFAATSALRAKHLAPCFDVLCNIVAPLQYSLTRSPPRDELARYAQLLCDTYTDSLRSALGHRARAGGGASDASFPSAVMLVASEAFWQLVVRVHTRLGVIARDAVRLSRAHQQLVRTGRVQRLSKAARRRAARERERYVRLLSAESVSIRQLILFSMRCMLGVAWPGSGILYQGAAPTAGAAAAAAAAAVAAASSGGAAVATAAAATAAAATAAAAAAAAAAVAVASSGGGADWGGGGGGDGQAPGPGPATEPGAMAATAIACISPFLKPLSLLLALSTLFPIRSLRNKGLAAHAEHARCLTLAEYREHYLLYYYYRPTTKGDDGEETEAGTVGDADALLDRSESRHYLSEFRSLWLLFTYYGFSSEALAVASATRRKAADPSLFYEGSHHLSKEQATVIRHIAASAAPLLQMRSSDMHQSVAEIVSLERYMGRSPLAGSGGIGGTRSVRRQLQRAMKRICGGVSHWEKLSVEELFLLRSLLDLEMLRAASGSIANLTLYLHFEVREFVASPAIKHVIQHVVSAVCALYLSTLETLPPKNTYQLVSKDIYQLVLLLSFSLASVRSAAMTVLDMILSSFPVFAAYSSGLQLLWAIINVLESGTAAQVEGFCRHAHFNAVPAVAADADSDDRRAQVQVLVQLAERWAEKARESAPRVLFQAAAKFVVGQSVMGAAGMQSASAAHGGSGSGGGGGGFKSASQLSGSRLAVKAAAEQSSAKEGDPSADVLAVGTTAPPNYAQSLIRYSNAQGQVLSAVRVSVFASVERMVVDLLGSVTRASVESSPYYPLTAHAKGPAAPSSEADGGRENSASRLYELDSLLCSSVALLTTGFTTASGTVELTRLITQGPIRVFSSEYIRAATDCWSWLLANDRERFMVPLLEHLADGIQWTVAQGLGLFDGARPSQNAEVQTGEGHGSDKADLPSDGGGLRSNPAEARTARLLRLYPSDYASNSPHKLLIAFLADTYVDAASPWSLDPDTLLVLYNLAFAMVQYPSRLSLKDASFAETMRVAVLVGHICRHLHVTNKRRQKGGEVVVVPYTSVAALRQRWYGCLLQWFRKTRPSWYFAGSPSLAVAEIPVLESLVHLLRAEESMLSRAALGFIDFSVGNPADAPLDVWSAASVVREQLEAIRRGSAAGDKAGDCDGARERLVKCEQERLKELLKLLRVLVQHELVRLRVWLTPRRTLRIPNPLSELSSDDWARLVDAAALNDPAVMVAMAARFPGYPAVHKACVRHVAEAPARFTSVPEAVDLYITSGALAAGAPHLFLFTDCTVVQALRYLDSCYAKHPQVCSYAIRSLLSQKSEYLIFYLPQLLQVLATDNSGSIQGFLLRMSHKSLMFCHQLLWCLQTEGEANSTLGNKCRALEARIKGEFDDAQAAFYAGEFDYTKVVTGLSGELMNYEKPQRKPKLRLRLQDAEFHDPTRRQHLYLPTDPAYRIVGVISRTAGAMQSAAKCPILVQFQCVPRDAEDMRTPAEIRAAAAANEGDGEEEEEGREEEGSGGVGGDKAVVKGCIFKMGDDCRQDQISLQLIGLMKRILDAVGVPSYLYPYRVVTTGRDSGIIEVVPKSMSRNEIGKLVESNVAEFYVQAFGHPESVRFHRARDNFVKSVASYSVVSFILNIKDRHNGNIMIDRDGHLVHIDFGFLFDTSPGGDMNFESSPFKLTTEMIQLIGKDVGGSSNLRSKSLAKALIDEESYIYFKTLVNRCYLAVRQYAREICVLVELMLRSGLPCFKPKQTIANLAKRLSVGKTEVEAANYMRERIHESRQNYRTVLYDVYQQVAEGIER